MATSGAVGANARVAADKFSLRHLQLNANRCLTKLCRSTGAPRPLNGG
jgi:hypothetical protein